MKVLFIVVIMLLHVSCILQSTARAMDSEKWFLMSRHGECVEIRALERKIPDIGTINDPQSFIIFMEENGYKVISNVPKELQGKGVQVSIPENELSLLFIQGSLCKEFLNR